MRIGTLAPIVPQRGGKLGEWILWRLQNMRRYFVFKWFMRYNICTCPLCNPLKVNSRDSAYQIEFAVQIPKIRGHVPRSAAEKPRKDSVRIFDL